jgi:hypothetical protein
MENKSLQYKLKLQKKILLQILFGRGLGGGLGQLGISVDKKRSLECLCFGFLIFNANKQGLQSILKLAHCFFTQVMVKVKNVRGKAIPLQAWTGPEKVKVPRFQDSRHMKMVRLPALCSAPLYTPGNIPGIHFC